MHRIFVYVPDKDKRNLEVRLNVLEVSLAKRGTVQIFSPHPFLGEEWEMTCLDALRKANIVIIISSVEIWDDEFFLKRMMSIIPKDATIVIINYRSVKLPEELSSCKHFPEGKSITEYPNKDRVWVNVTTQLITYIDTLSEAEEGETNMTNKREARRIRIQAEKSQAATQQSVIKNVSLQVKISDALRQADMNLDTARETQVKVYSFSGGPADINPDILATLGHHDPLKFVYDQYKLITGPRPESADFSSWTMMLGSVPRAVYEYLKKEGYVLFLTYGSSEDKHKDDRPVSRLELWAADKDDPSNFRK